MRAAAWGGADAGVKVWDERVKGRCMLALPWITNQVLSLLHAAVSLNCLIPRPPPPPPPLCPTKTKRAWLGGTLMTSPFHISTS